MSLIKGYVRIALTVATLVAVFFLVAMGRLLGVRRNKVPLSTWLAMPGAWAFAKIYNIRMNCHDLDRLRKHRGLILANHQSYFDIILTFNFIPARYVAAIEVRKRPVLGWISESIGCIFIERGNVKSGLQVKNKLAQIFREEPDPPVVIFPEGRMGDGRSLFTFRRGIFRIAAENEIPYLLCAIKYSRPEVITWHGGRGESMASAILRLAKHGEAIEADLIPLETIYPQPDDSPQALAVQARAIIAAGLGIELDAE